MTTNVSQKALELIKKGLSLELSTNELVNYAGVSRSTVYRAYKALGIHRERDINASRAAVLSGWREGLHIDDIAEKAGITRAHVYYVMRGLGIEPDFQQRLEYSPEPCVIEGIDPGWAAEFRGLFYGEGCATLEATTDKSFRPALIVVLRKDDAAMLEEIHLALGGYYQDNIEKGGGRKPQARWAAYGWPRCKTVIEVTDLTEGFLPAKKRKDISLLYEAILARLAMPKIFSEENRRTLRDFHRRIKAVKRYQL